MKPDSWLIYLKAMGDVYTHAMYDSVFGMKSLLCNFCTNRNPIQSKISLFFFKGWRVSSPFFMRKNGDIGLIFSDASSDSIVKKKRQKMRGNVIKRIGKCINIRPYDYNNNTTSDSVKKDSVISDTNNDMRALDNSQ